MFIEPNSERWLSLEDLPNERWKDIKDFEGLYQISNYGRVKSLKRTITRNGSYPYYVNINECIRKLRKNKQGYWYLNLFEKGVCKTRKVHRLVAEHFIENHYNYPFVNHKDGNKLNNRVDNLEWCTPSYNTNHAYKLGLSKAWNKGVYGSANKTTKAVNQYDLNGNFIKTWDCIKDVERILKIESCNITRTCQGKRLSAGGFIWEYARVDNE